MLSNQLWQRVWHLTVKSCLLFLKIYCGWFQRDSWPTWHDGVSPWEMRGCFYLDLMLCLPNLRGTEGWACELRLKMLSFHHYNGSVCFRRRDVNLVLQWGRSNDCLTIRNQDSSSTHILQKVELCQLKYLKSFETSWCLEAWNWITGKPIRLLQAKPSKWEAVEVTEAYLSSSPATQIKHILELNQARVDRERLWTSLVVLS